MFRKTTVYDLPYNVFQEINKNWMLISARNPEGKVNTMTASWGMMGELWNREAVTVYVRQTRYTKEFIDSQDYFTLSLFDGHREALSLLGTKSGRDGDKIAESGLTPETVDGQPAFRESKCLLIVKKMYQDDIPLEAMSPEIRNGFYGDGDFHTMYVGEIVGCYVKED